MGYRRALTNEGLMMLVGRNVKRLRYASGQTATAAAASGGLPLRTWQKVEAGEANATLETLAKVSVGLGVDVGELFQEQPSRR